MNSAISDLALDLGVFALDNEFENGMSHEERTLITHSPAPAVHGSPDRRSNEATEQEQYWGGTKSHVA